MILRSVISLFRPPSPDIFKICRAFKKYYHLDKESRRSYYAPKFLTKRSLVCWAVLTVFLDNPILFIASILSVLFVIPFSALSYVMSLIG